MRLDLFDVAMAFCCAVLLLSLVVAYGFSHYYEHKSKELQSENLLRSYEIETERKKAEAMLINAKALELSCAAELVNEFGEVYKR